MSVNCSEPRLSGVTRSRQAHVLNAFGRQRNQIEYIEYHHVSSCISTIYKYHQISTNCISMREIGKQLCMKLIICRGLMVVRRIELCSSPLDFLGLQDYLLVDVHVLVIYSPPSCEVLMTVIRWWHLLMSSHLSKLCKQLLILWAVLKADSRTQHNCQKLIVQQHGEHIMVLYNNFINKEKTKPGQTEKHTNTRTHACWFVFFSVGSVFWEICFWLCYFFVCFHFLAKKALSLFKMVS